MAVPSGVDPREVLGVGPDAGAGEITAAFRRLAKRWHPDHAPDAGTGDRMALLNAAYAALRAPAAEPVAPGAARPAPAAGPTVVVRRADLAPAVRRALGAELRRTVEAGEEVGIVVPTSTWASPQTTLAVTDRRVLWLLDDAPVHRVRTLALGDVTDVRVRPPRPWRRRAQVVVTDRRGRRTTFGELPLPTATAVARRIGTPGSPAAAGTARDRERAS